MGGAPDQRRRGCTTRRRLFVATLGRSARHGEGVDEATPVTDLDSPIMDRTDRRRRKRRARHTGSSRLSVVVTGVTRLSSWAREVGPAGLRTICCVSSGGRACRGRSAPALSGEHLHNDVGDGPRWRDMIFAGCVEEVAAHAAWYAVQLSTLMFLGTFLADPRTRRLRSWTTSPSS